MKYDPRDFGLTVGKRARHEVSVVCPFHKDHNPSALFNVETGLFYCFVCHKGMSPQALGKALGVVVKRSASTVGMERQGERYLSGIDTEWVSRWQAAHPARDSAYLDARRVPGWLADELHVREDRDAMLFPMFDRGMRLIGMLVRKKFGEPRYLALGEKTPVWPMWLWPGGQEMLLTEGVFGALNVRKHGYEGFAALSSAIPSSTWAALSPFGERIVVLFDNDDAGHHGAFTIAQNVGARIAWPGAEADEIDSERIEELVAAARSLPELVLDRRIR